nr:MAG TPA: hypothetical protein [Caudoviricetes sp.]
MITTVKTCISNIHINSAPIGGIKAIAEIKILYRR